MNFVFMGNYHFGRLFKVLCLQSVVVGFGLFCLVYRFVGFVSLLDKL